MDRITENRRLIFCYYLCIYFLLFIITFIQSAQALTASTEQVLVRVIGNQATLNKGEKQTIFGLLFDLQPGWKIYWNHPGASGKSPTLDWSQSNNIARMSFLWPKPTRFRDYNLLSYGYSNQVVLPVSLERDNPDTSITWNVKVDFFICREVCIPDHIYLKGLIPTNEETYISPVTVNSAKLKAALTKVPKPDLGLLRVSTPRAVLGSNNVWRIKWSVVALSPQSEIEAFFIGTAADIALSDEPYFLEPLIKFNNKRYSFTVSTEASNLSIDQPIRLYLAYQHNGKKYFNYFDFSQLEVESVDWLRALFFAILGGLLLNIMPCILPVVMLKIFAFLHHNKIDKSVTTSNIARSLRSNMLNVSVGIIIGFILLGIIFIIIRQTGFTLHWGMQFQQPLFLSAMALILFVFAAQIWGWWSWHLPGRINLILSRWNIKYPKVGNYINDILSGLLIVFIATPCSAPFLGIAISIALFAGTNILMLIFIGMGLGMALPYLVVTCMPTSFWYRFGYWHIIRDHWIVYIQRIIGICLLITALWFIWLLSMLIGLIGALILLGIGLFILLILSIHFISKTKIVNYRSLITILLIVLGLTISQKFSIIYDRSIIDSSGWVEFIPSDIEMYLEQGKVVLVDISASWCITCMINNQRVFNTPRVVAWRHNPEVIAMRGNWNQPDPLIKHFVSLYQRHSLPFTILFSPYAPEGVMLPALLSTSAFKEALLHVHSSIKL